MKSKLAGSDRTRIIGSTVRAGESDANVKLTASPRQRAAPTAWMASPLARSWTSSPSSRTIDTTEPPRRSSTVPFSRTFSRGVAPWAASWVDAISDSGSNGPSPI